MRRQRSTSQVASTPATRRQSFWPGFRLSLAVVCVFGLIVASCSDGGESNAASGDADSTATEAPAAADASPPADTDDEPEFIEITYFEGTERATFVFEGGNDRCEEIDAQTERCEVDLGFDSVATHLGRARDASVMETTNHAVSCPTSDLPGTQVDFKGTITSQWGDEVFFDARTNCPPYPTYWVVTGGTGRFEGASGVMSNTRTDHPNYLSFGTGQLSVQADLWVDVLPPAPATSPDPGVEYLDIAYFEGIVSTASATQPADDCDRSDPDEIVCTSTGSGELQAALIGDGSQTWTGTTTQQLTEACELDDGTSAVPAVIDATGRITAESGDELSYTARTHVDPCATLGSGTSGTTSYWRATGGTGRFADAQGLISGVATPGLGFEAIGAGTLSVRADEWPEFADEFAALPSGPEYIELRYFERFLTGVEVTVESPEECDSSEAGTEICRYEIAGKLTGTHIGAASELQSGTITQQRDATCETGTPWIREGAGVITAPWGDEVQFRNVDDPCTLKFWTIDGGTGRFDGAAGVMTGLDASQMGDDTALIQTGTFHLRADLWDDLIPDRG